MEHKEGSGVCPYCGYSPDTPFMPSYLPPGTYLNDRYVVGRLLRYNGEGADYIGYDTGTGTKVTIREYMPDTLCSRTKESTVLSVKQNCVAQYKAFMSEFVELNKMLAKMRTLSHINPAIDMFGDNNTGYVVFRYIEGVNLSKFLKEHAGELTWEEVKKLFPPIFTTLSLVHNAGLVHRGIAPENIIVTEKNELKLIGFCIADARTANTELAGEIYPGFAAPEQYSSSNWQGTWTDVYGICALLYRILTGTAPTDAMERVANDTLVEPRALNGNIPVNVSKVIMNGMCLSGEMRIQTVTELVTQLFEEPDFNKTKSQNATQTISIPKQHSTGSTLSHTEEKSRSSSKSKKARKHTTFVITSVLAICLLMGFMSLAMMKLDDDSGKVIDGIPTSTAAAAESQLTDEAGVTIGGDVSASDTDGSSGAAVTTVPSALNGGTTGASTLPTLGVLQSTATDEETDEAPVTTTIRPGAAVYIMNDLVGKYYDTVKNTSINESLTLNPEYVYTDEYEKGIIFDQSIEKGTNYEKGAELTLKISMGPGQVVIPEYYGLSKKDYFDILNSLGIKYEEISYPTESVYNDYVAWIDKADSEEGFGPGQYIDLEAGEVLKVFVAQNEKSSETSETTVTTTETEPESTPWITTETPTITVTETETETEYSEETSATETEPQEFSETTPFTAEPDIIITDDY